MFSEVPARTILPFEHQAAVTPSDSAGLDPIPRALYVGVGGDIVIEASGSGIVSWTVPSGYMIRGRIIRVFATGTTAGNIIAVW